MSLNTEVSYARYDKSSNKKTRNIFTFAQFEEANLLLESHNGTENNDKSDESDDGSTFPLLISKAKMDEMSSVDECDAEPTPTDVLEDICDGSLFHPIINRREARYKICDCIKKCEWNGKESYYKSKTWEKVHTFLNAVANKLLG